MSAEEVTFVVAAALSLVLTLGLGLHYWPDVELYTSGVALFPSPVGTLLGTGLGMEGLAFVQALCCGAIAAGLVVLRPPFRAVVAALPVLVWCAILGVDVLAAVLFVVGTLTGREWLRWLAGLVHLSELVLVVVTSRARWAVSGGVLGVALLAGTSYRAGVSGSLAVLPAATFAGVVVVAVGLLPGLVSGVRVWRERRLLLLGAGTGAAVAFAVRHDLAAGWPWYWTTSHTFRYALPLVLMGLVAASAQVDGERSRLRRLRDRRALMRLWPLAPGSLAGTRSRPLMRYRGGTARSAVTSAGLIDAGTSSDSRSGDSQSRIEHLKVTDWHLTFVAGGPLSPAPVEPGSRPRQRA